MSSILEYTYLLERASQLSKQQKSDLVATLEEQLRNGTNGKRTRSIMELEGLGKEIWEDIDAQEYVNQERKSWNG